ncbi:hypothetical protein C5E45_15615, partial [Nocardia nova]
MSSSTSQFGQNQWLVDEMYQKYKQDPSSVDESWHEFLADYTPESPGEIANSTPAASAPTAAPSAPATPAPAPANVNNAAPKTAPTPAPAPPPAPT